MKISVFLDDYRTCPPEHHLATDIDECIHFLENFHIEHLSLDHDLVSKERNGFMLVKHMVAESLFADRITIHSANAVGGRAMFDYLKKAQRNFEMPAGIKIIHRPMPLR